MAATTESPARRLMARLDALAAFTDDPPKLTRLCLSPSHRRAAEQFIAWAGESGLSARIDPVGNVRARYEGRRPGAPALMIGSHIDTVRDAGRYDGALGALAALSVVEGLAAQRRRLDVAIEIVAFGDEEGVRFPHTLTGSRGLVGVNEPEALAQKDADGVSMRDALKAFGGDPDHLGAARAEGVAAFVELHIEQGPVLEAEGRPLGVVTAINGSTRLSAVVTGAPATPARRRWTSGATRSPPPPRWCWRSKRARAPRTNSSPPSAGSTSSPARSTSFPAGRASRSTCARRSTSRAAAPSPTSPRRCRRSPASRRQARTHADPRGGGLRLPPEIVAGLEAAVAAVGAEPRLLPSGAGHDTMVMGQRWPAGMLFVRCKGGVSHNPAESISEADCAIALAALTRFVEDFRAS